jgi:hypothetical protein
MMIVGRLIEEQRHTQFWLFKTDICICFWYISICLSWPWSYYSWIYNYLCKQCLSLLMLWIRISIRARCTTLCDKVSQWLATGWWFSPGPRVSSTNKTDRHDITEIPSNKQTNINLFEFFFITINAFTYRAELNKEVFALPEHVLRVNVWCFVNFQ